MEPWDPPGPIGPNNDETHDTIPHDKSGFNIQNKAHETLSENQWKQKTSPMRQNCAALLIHLYDINKATSLVRKEMHN